MFLFYGGIFEVFLHMVVYFDFKKFLAKDLFLSGPYPDRERCDEKISLVLLAVCSPRSGLILPGLYDELCVPERFVLKHSPSWGILSDSFIMTHAWIFFFKS